MGLSNLSRKDLEVIQLKKLVRLLSFVKKNSFYTQKFNSADISATISSISDFSRIIPFTSKDELIEDQASHPPFGSNLTFPINQYTRYSQTSGTTQKPLRWLDTPESWKAMIDNWQTVFRKGRISSNDRLFIPFSFGPFLGFWTAFEAAAHLGCLCVPGGGLSTQARINCILDNAITVICCTPTYAIRLAIAASEKNIDLTKSKVKSVIVAGEPGGSLSETRRQIETLWHGATIIDHHGMTEIGPASYQCPEHPGTLHIIESSYYAEVVDHDTREPVSPGTTGELIITTLDRLGSPVLRYHTGDLVRVGEKKQCSCGSYELSLVGGILGRYDDMISVRGVNIFPGAIDNIVRNFESISEYRVKSTLQKGMVELSLQVEINPAFDNPKDICQALEIAISNAFSIRVPVTQVANGILPRFEMKAKRWIKSGLFLET